MLRSMYAGVSGLRNHQTRLDVIGNNIANVNTIGFKSSRVTFKDLFSQTLRAATSAQSGRGGSNPIQVGLGMTLASIDTDHGDGSIQYTGKATDLAIEGSGFFIIRDGNTLMYTRAGNFDLDEEGYLVVPGTGYRVQGLDLASGVDGKLTDIRVSTGTTYDPRATTRIDFANNLDVTADVGTEVVTSIEVYDSLGRLHVVNMTFTRGANDTNSWDWAAYSTVTERVNISGNLDYTDSASVEDTIRVTDSTGKQYTVVLEFTYDNVTDTWQWETEIDGVAISGPPTGTQPITVGDSDIYLDFSGLSIGSGGTTLATVAVGTELESGTLEFDEHGRIKDGSKAGEIELQLSLATSPQKIALDFSAVTGTAAETSISIPYRDGAPQGALQSYSIDGAGNIVGEFSNGLISTVGKVALARFANPAGLMKVGNTAFVESNNSGLKQIGQAGTAGFGSIASSSLEMSNVDLSLEFTEMIVTQRGLQANSRIITTSDEVLQEVVNLKR